MRLLWLPQVLRDAGLTVHTYQGWETRGSDRWGPLRGIVCHATAGARNSSDAGEMRVLWETGSTTAPTPIAQLYLSRTGTWWVGASGLCYHALIGQRGPHKGYGNSALIGVEAANDNRGEPWPAVQVDAYIRGVAAICRHMGWNADVVVGHREHQNDKTDPAGIDMDQFRARVAALLQEDDMAFPTDNQHTIHNLDRFLSAAAFGLPTVTGLKAPDGTEHPPVPNPLYREPSRTVDVQALADALAPALTEQVLARVRTEIQGILAAAFEGASDAVRPGGE